MLFAADIWCNILDGIAIGIAFASDDDHAWGTFIAIWAHEFP